MAAVRSVTLVKSQRRSAWRSTMEKNTFLVSSTGASGASSESTSPLTGLAASAAARPNGPPCVWLPSEASFCIDLLPTIYGQAGLTDRPGVNLPTNER